MKKKTDLFETLAEATEPCNLQNVIPRFIPENLILKSGVHLIRVDVFDDYRKQPACRITCIDNNSDTQDMDGNWIDERSDGCFYTKAEHIDQIIAKLQEAKAFINGA